MLSNGNLYLNCERVCVCVCVCACVCIYIYIYYYYYYYKKCPYGDIYSFYTEIYNPGFP